MADAVVVPDGCGQGQDALSDAGANPGDGAALVVFEVELAFEGVIDRFDDLPEGFEESVTGGWCLALAGWSELGDALVGQGGLEGAAVIVLVADDRRRFPGV